MNNRISLATNQVHVWLIDEHEVLLANTVEHMSAKLSAQELQQASEMKSTTRQQTFLISRAALRSILQKYADVEDLSSLVFTAGEHGKPAIKNNPAALQFNLSHSGNYIVIAVARNWEVGVDIEVARPGRDINKIAESYFHPAEWQSNTGDSDEQKFYALWTLKEAYIKAEGKGLAIPLKDFYFDLADPGAPTLMKTRALQASSRDWQFRQYSIADDVSLAIAVERAGTSEPLAVLGWRYIDDNQCTPFTLPTP